MQQTNPLLILSDLRQQIEQTQAEAQATKEGLEQALQVVKIDEYPLAERLAHKAIKDRIAGYESLLEFCRHALLAGLFIALTSCGNGFKNYRHIETVRAARVGDKVLKQWQDNYACPGCIRLPDNQLAHPGEWVVIKGNSYFIVQPADFRRNYRRK